MCRSLELIIELHESVLKVEAFGVDCFAEVLLNIIEVFCVDQVDPLPLARLLEVLVVLLDELVEVLRDVLLPAFDVLEGAATRIILYLLANLLFRLSCIQHLQEQGFMPLDQFLGASLVIELKQILAPRLVGALLEYLYNILLIPQHRDQVLLVEVARGHAVLYYFSLTHIKSVLEDGGLVHLLYHVGEYLLVIFDFCNALIAAEDGVHDVVLIVLPPYGRFHHDLLSKLDLIQKNCVHVVVEGVVPLRHASLQHLVILIRLEYLLLRHSLLDLVVYFSMNLLEHILRLLLVNIC